MTSEAGARDSEARRRAVVPGESCIVQAPAGSGKTTLLTLRYLQLLGSVEHPEQIVAVTFTRKAAAEMRHRIVAALEAAQKPIPADADERVRELHRCGAAALARSRALGWGLEHNPARLHVQTIDGLNHWLARRLPLAAGVSTSATLVDDARALYTEAARRTVARLDDGSPVAAALVRLARSVNHEPRQLANLVEGMLGARELWLSKLLHGASGTELRAGIERLLRQALESELGTAAAATAGVDWGELLAICRAAAAAGAPDSPARRLAALAGTPPTTADWVPAWQALASLLLRSDKPVLLKQVGASQGFLAAGENPAWGPLKRRMKEFLESLAGDEALAPALHRLRALPPPALTEGQWERIEALTGVLPNAVAELTVLFAERDSLDHPAVAAAARAALCEVSAPTDLALALDYRIHHLLVDEYQDTSPSQAQLLELLVAGWQPGDGRSLFCVGDPMQSIYAFREADVTLFLQAQRQGLGGVALSPLHLGRNFRSSPAIVGWINATFGALLPPADDFERGAVRYSPAEAAVAGTAGDGVRVHALIGHDERAMAAEVVAVVRDAIDTLSNPSIAILVRGRPSLPPILTALREAGIPYRGVELEGLLDRPAIRDLVALLRALLHEGDRTAWLAALRAPWCGLSLADLTTLAANGPVPGLRERLQDAAGLAGESALRARGFAATMEDVIAARGERSLGGWLKSAWLALGGPATIDDASDLANAELLFAALDRLEREASGRPQLSEIEAAVEGIMASPVGREDAGVQVMTIHRAKGLEFDVVVLPDLQRSARRSERPLLYWTTIATGPGERGIVLASRADSAEEEGGADPLERWMRKLGAEREALELGRLAYVAATRARRRLHLIGSAGIKQGSEGAVLNSPKAASLLGFLWPVMAAHFEQALAAQPAGLAARGSERRRLAAPPARRLPGNLRLPDPPPLPRAAVLRIRGEPEGSIRPAFDWAGAIAQAVGQVVHAELQRMSDPGALTEDDARRHARWRRELAALGIDETHQEAALARARRAMKTVAGSALARRLLDPAARDGSSELALTVLIDGAAHGMRIDRSFVDESGTRWVVDWKTSAHEGGDPDDFLDRELERYRGQLERYARAMRLMEPGRPLKVGLYFPLLDAWREL